MKHVSRLASLVRLTSLSLASAALALGSRAGTLDLAVRGRAPEYAIVRAAVTLWVYGVFVGVDMIPTCFVFHGSKSGRVEFQSIFKSFHL